MQTIHILEKRLVHLKGVISQLTNEQYSQSLTILHRASIGGHVRHIIEFFQCLLAQYPEGKVNYDLRKRDKFLENSIERAMVEIDYIRTQLRTLSLNTPLNTPLTLEAELSTSSDCNSLIPTCLIRELVYQLEHTIHHMALIKIALTHSFETIEVPEEFGVAASTLKNSGLLVS
jgi:hypothetical protein